MTTQRLWGKRFNKGVMALATLGLGIWLVRAAALGVAALLLTPVAVLFWFYVVAIVILIEWAVLRLQRRGVPAIPGVPARFLGTQPLLVTLCMYVALMTIAREGAFVTVSQYDTTTNTQIRTVTSSQQFGSVRFAGRPVVCNANCTPQGSAACTALLATISCDEETSGESASVHAQISLGPEPFCFVPLYKSGELRFDINATIHASDNATGAQTTRSLHVSGSMQLEMTGVGSCYTFRQVLGTTAGNHFVGALNDVLRNN